MSKKVTFPCMGTTFCVEASNALALESWLHRVEKNYSRFRTESELSQLNQLELSKEWVPISKEFYNILQLSEGYRLSTDSFFNPYLGQQLVALGYDKLFSDLSKSGFEQKRIVTPFEESPLLFHSEKAMIKKVKEVSVDLGGFVKGWSVDEVYCMAKGNERFIDGGGDLRFSFEKPIEIGVINPFHFDTDVARLKMRTGAMATSSVVHRRWQTTDGEVHHLLNGRTGKNAVSDVVQVTVLGSTVREAEVYAKVLCMMDVESAENWIMDKKLTIAAILITKNQRIVMTKNIKDYCEGVETAWS